MRRGGLGGENAALVKLNVSIRLWSFYPTLLNGFRATDLIFSPFILLQHNMVWRRKNPKPDSPFISFQLWLSRWKLLPLFLSAMERVKLSPVFSTVPFLSYSDLVKSMIDPALAATRWRCFTFRGRCIMDYVIIHGACLWWATHD